MANGFLTESPAARHGSAVFGSTANVQYFEHFTCGGIGTQNITEIGIWGSADAATEAYLHLSIFTDDETNTCPEIIVESSDSGELVITSTDVVKTSLTYGTQPQCTGGVHYWIGLIWKDVNFNIDYISTGGTTVQKAGTYPTWSTGDAWHTHTDRAFDLGIYAVYVAAAGGSILPLVAFGTLGGNCNPMMG